MNYLTRFAELHAFLLAQSSVQVQKFYVPEAVKPAVWSKVPKRFRGSLRGVPADLCAPYMEMHKIEVQWVGQCPSAGPESVSGCIHLQSFWGLAAQETTFGLPDNTLTHRFFGDENLTESRQAELRTYRIWERLPYNTYVLWREVGKQTQLALYLGGDRLHPLPFSPTQYLDTGLALRFLELWQLLFIAEAEQEDYAEALGTIVAQVRGLFPEALPLLPAHMAGLTAAPPPAGPDYQQLFATVIARLQATPGVKLDVVQAGQYPEAKQPPSLGATLGAFERVRRATARPVPTALRAFYGQLNGCRLDWAWQDATAPLPDQHPRGGSLTFWPLEVVFGGYHYDTVQYWDDFIHEGKLWAEGHTSWVPGLAGLRPFEYITAEAYPCLRLPEAPDSSVKLYWLGGDLDDIAPLQLDFTTYMQRAFACAGVYNWQLFYRSGGLTDVDSSFMHTVEEDLRRLGLGLAQVLPDR